MHRLCSARGWYLGVLVPLSAIAATAGEHPRLLLTPADVPRLRHACGLGPLPTTEPADGKPGSASRDFQALRTRLSGLAGGEPLPGEVAAAALLHLLEPRDSHAAARLRLVEAGLGQIGGPTTDTLELVIALDWCWANVDAAARRQFLLDMRERAAALAPEDSPLDPRVFREKLAALALALAIDEDDEPNPSWHSLRGHLMESARKYFAATFPNFVAWRGLSPTSPSAGPREECDTVLAIELAGRLLERDLWSENRTTVGRWLEHYALSHGEHPSLQHGFLRDDGSAAPLTPAPAWRDLLPVTAPLLAARTGDPTAVWIARRVCDSLRSGDDHLAGAWRWVPIVFDNRPSITPVPARDPQPDSSDGSARRLPAARNLGGAVVFRGGAGPEATTVWIEAGQPFLRRRQHFDAGHFLIRRGGELVPDSGDDVTLEAVPGKQGEQRLGRASEPFDFEQFFTATIAHNCVVCWDAAQFPTWYGARYLPAGGQRCIENTCTDFATPLAGQNRLTARQLAYGQQDDLAYLALDLAPAYDSRSISHYLREFVFLAGRVLIVVDRVNLATSRSPATWVLNLPHRPQVDAADLADSARVAGSTNEAGVWRYDEAGWLRWGDRDGALWMRVLQPAPRCLRVVGGPGRETPIDRGPAASRRYVGGTADGFERLVIPAERRNAVNAWYRLGAPTLLGPAFDKVSHWGRVEVESLDRARFALFVTILVTDRADGRDAPTADLGISGDDRLVTVSIGEVRARLRLAGGMQPGGDLEVVAPAATAWKLPDSVEADPPLTLGMLPAAD